MGEGSLQFFIKLIQLPTNDSPVILLLNFTAARLTKLLADRRIGEEVVNLTSQIVRVFWIDQQPILTV